jgi:hypothetical protein
VWGKRKGHGEQRAALAQAIVIGVKAHGGEAGSAGVDYFDLDLRARFDDAAPASSAAVSADRSRVPD